MRRNTLHALVGTTVLCMVGGSSIFAQETPATTLTLEGLNEEVEALRRDLEVARQQTNALSATANQAVEWRQTARAFHFAGYASAGYTDVENQTEVFAPVTFNPLFLFQYRDRVFFEAELEVEIEEDGETENHLEYANVSYFVNDNLTLSVGKFLSPLGYFRQNLHPAWVNRLPSAPPGFGHDGAAPESEIGVQLRGGVPIGDNRLNYSFYIGNGPELDAEDEEVHGILTDGFTRDADGRQVFGGRLGFQPSLHFEVGLSAAVGDTSVTEDHGIEVEDEPIRDYEAFGVDFVYHWTDAEIRGEYIRQDIGTAPLSVAPEGGEWEAWYLQGNYSFAQNRWEGVLRYADFDSPHATQRQKQWVVGINRLISASAILKLAYEINSNDVGASTDDNRWLFQATYGF